VVVLDRPAPVAPGTLGEAAARRTLRAQVARLERELGDVLVAAFPWSGVVPAPVARGRGVAAFPRAGVVPGPGCAPVPAARTGPRLLGLGELEAHRDELSDRLAAARRAFAERTTAEERARELLERMLLEPGRHRFARVKRADLGEAGCGAWHVRPRVGLIGMLMGWWQVKLSSGCPPAT